MKKAADKPKPEKLIVLPRRQITADDEMQSRECVDLETVERYCDESRAGCTFPPIRVVTDGMTWWVWDGFTRLAMYDLLKSTKIECLVRQGSRRDALLLAIGANSDHGKPRTLADKSRAVMMLLNDAEWSKASVRWMADHAKVSRTLVERLIDDAGKDKPKGNVTGRDGKIYPTPPSPPPAGQVALKPPVGKSDTFEISTDPDDLEGLGDATEPVQLAKALVEDDFDRPVPDRLAEIFTSSQEAKKLAVDLARIKNRLAQLFKGPAGCSVPMSDVAAKLDSAIQSIRMGRPMALCPECEGVDKPDAEACPTCKWGHDRTYWSRGWIHHTRMEQLPTKFRAKIEQHMRKGA